MKTVLITGASRGIGRATALLAAQEGWQVIVNFAGNQVAADDVVSQINDNGGHAVAVQGDISQEEGIKAMFDTAEQFGDLRAVVANAGILGPIAKIADMDADRMRRVVDVNVMGTLLTARETVRRLATSRGGAGGSLVIVSSAAARIGSPNEFVDYAATKGAADTLVLGLSKEAGPDGIRVNSVRPGLIDTDMQSATGWAERAHELGTNAPLGRAGTPDETAEAIVWLISDKSSYVSGALLDVSAGR